MVRERVRLMLVRPVCEAELRLRVWTCALRGNVMRSR